MSRYNYRNNTAGALDSDHIYYNINYTDPESGSAADINGNVIELTTNNKELVFNFNQTRAAPYLQCPEDYYLSVLRFTIESPNLPVFTVQPIQGGAPSQTIYTVTIMGTNNIPYKKAVEWVPQDYTQGIPATPVSNTPTSPADPYYYCYSYSYFVECINKALDYIWVTNLGGTTGEGPYLYYDASKYLFTLGGPVSAFRTKLNGDILGLYNIYFNVPLLNLMSSLPAKYVAGEVIVVSSDNKQMDYKMILSTGTDSLATVQPYVSNIRVNPITSDIDVYSTQEYSTLPLWTPITAIVFKTSLLTTNPEIMGTPVVYANNNQNINGGKQNADILNILTEHYATLITGTEYKPFIFYEPTGEFKLTDLYGKNPLSDIDISVFWRDNYGNLIPFKLGIGCSATIKILFRKKTFNSDK